MAHDTFDLQRFLDAQEQDFDVALGEIRSGRKLSHWIWYVFPQLAGLGHSYMCQIYGIRGIEEARAYLAHPVLRARLEQITSALLELDERDPVRVMGGIDALKLRSCMTLFSRVEGASSVFAQVIDEFYGGEPDSLTLQMLGTQG